MSCLTINQQFGHEAKESRCGQRQVMFVSGQASKNGMAGSTLFTLMVSQTTKKMRLRTTSSPLNGHQQHGQAADEEEPPPTRREGQDNNKNKSMFGFETEYIRRKYFIMRPHYKVEIQFSISDIIVMVLMILSTLILINLRLSSSIGSQSTTSSTDTGMIGLDKSLRGFLQRSLTTNNNGRIQQLHSNKRIDDNNYYDPTKCKHMINGHCDDANVGGAWMYRDSNGNCLYTENNDGTNNAPQSYHAVTKLRTIFPNVSSVADYGGGPGTYLVGFLHKVVVVKHYHHHHDQFVLLPLNHIHSMNVYLATYYKIPQTGLIHHCHDYQMNKLKY